MEKKRSTSKGRAVQRTGSQKAEKAARDREFKELEKIAAKYQTNIRQAWTRVGGPDENVMRSEMEKISKLKDPDARKQKAEEFHRRYAPLMKQACEAGINAGEVRQEILAAVSVPARARVNDETGPALSWHTEPDFERLSPLPAPRSVTEVILTAPYELQRKIGDAAAYASTGLIAAGGYVSLVGGSSQSVASVGSSFRADADVAHVRVEGTINLDYFRAHAYAFLGYGSAEIILNFKVFDGTRLVGSNRLSLLRVISVVLWDSTGAGSGQYTFAVEFDQAAGTPRTYTAMGEVEAWVGGGGLSVDVDADDRGWLRQLRVILVR